VVVKLTRESVEVAISEYELVGADKFVLEHGCHGVKGPILTYEGRSLDAISIVSYAGKLLGDEKNPLPEQIDIISDITKPLRRAGFVVREHLDVEQRFWWVNQDQTREEFEVGFMWSPFTRKDGKSNPNYEFMSETSPGDYVVSYWAGLLQGVGSVTHEPVVSPKPAYRDAESWADEGWYVQVAFEPFSTPFTPKDHIDSIRPLLPERNSPLQADGNGREFYLTEISGELFGLLGKIGGETSATTGSASALAKPAKERAAYRPSELLDDKHESDLRQRTDFAGPLEKERLTKARRGQGVFKRRVQAIEKACRVTGTCQIRHLIASHIKPWRLSDDSEKLDGNNGLLLAPHVDHLFNDGWISFELDGSLLVSKHLPSEILERWKIDRHLNVGPFNQNQSKYLDFHRTYLFQR